jgi:hypothetical protein
LMKTESGITNWLKRENRYWKILNSNSKPKET